MSTTVSNTTMGSDGAIQRTEHSLSWTGLAGIMVWTSVAALFILVVGYATTGWYTVTSVDGTVEEGLWETCFCGGNSNTADYVKATQAFTTMALITLIAAGALSICYILVHFLPKKLLLIGAMVSFAVSALFLLIAVAVFGAESAKENAGGNPSYSFAFAVISMIICIAGAGVSFLQMRKSGSF